MSNTTLSIVERARIFATAAHSAINQKRKYTHESYIVHLAEVVRLVQQVQHTDEMLAAAWLHDVVEDTGVTTELLRVEFGENVAKMVLWLTDVSSVNDGNRAHRKAIDRAHSANAPADVQTIKVADLISNSRSIMASDPKFALVYLEEKRLLLDVLVRANETLRTQAYLMIKKTADGNDMYHTHNTASIDLSGTHKQGQLTGVTYHTLCHYFGPPSSGGNHRCSVRWSICFDDGLIASIHDWKTAPNYCGPGGVEAIDQTEWYIGGKTPEVVTRIRAIVEAQSTSTNDTKMYPIRSECNDTVWA